jgi:hypothetical protein
LWPETTKRSSTEQISAQLSKFQSDSSARNTFLEQISTFSLNFAKNRSFDKIWKLTYSISEVGN